MPHVIISVRISEAVHQRLTLKAMRDGITVPDHITKVLAASVADELIQS